MVTITLTFFKLNSELLIDPQLIFHKRFNKEVMTKTSTMLDSFNSNEIGTADYHRKVPRCLYYPCDLAFLDDQQFPRTKGLSSLIRIVPYTPEFIVMLSTATSSFINEMTFSTSPFSMVEGYKNYKNKQIHFQQYNNESSKLLKQVV